MAKRFGTVLTFREGVTKSQADAALSKLEDSGLLADDWIVAPGSIGGYKLQEFNDDMGGPVWYIP